MDTTSSSASVPSTPDPADLQTPRKRYFDEPPAVASTLSKRRRISTRASLGDPTMYRGPRTSLQRQFLRGEDLPLSLSQNHLRNVSSSSSMDLFSRASSVIPSDLDTSLSLPMGPPLLSTLTRSASMSSIASYASTSVSQTYSQMSAKHNLQNTNLIVDYKGLAPSPGRKKKAFLGCSRSDMLIFTRENSILVKSFATDTTDDVMEMCKIPESKGVFCAMACGGMDQNPDVVAVSTTKGGIQVYDLATRKQVLQWASLKNVTALNWNGPVLAIGSERGTIKHYDTRIKVTEKMKEQALKRLRHQAAITSIAWNDTRRFMASGDESGSVLIWENGHQRPLEIGEETQRRKQIKHDSSIVTVAFSPHQPKTLVTAETNGIVRLWDINLQTQASNAMSPSRLETGCTLTGLHLTPQCSEMLTLHGETLPPPPPSTSRRSVDHVASRVPSPPPVDYSHSFLVHSFPSLRHVRTTRFPAQREALGREYTRYRRNVDVSNLSIGDNVMNLAKTRLAFAAPEANQLHMYDIWGKKPKQVRRQSSVRDIVVR